MEINEKKLKEILRGERQEFQKYVDKKLEKQTTIQRQEFQSFVGKQITIQREEFQNHTGALAEEFQSQTQAVAEQYSDINKKLDSHSEMIAGLAEDMEVVKMELTSQCLSGFWNSDL